MAVVPGLFGITHSNRDFSLKDTGERISLTRLFQQP